MENQEKIQDSLTEFDKTPSKDIPPILEDYLKTVAKTGKTVFPWQLLKSLFVQKLEQVMDEFNKEEPCERPNPFPNVENAKFVDMQERIIDAMQKFKSAPFTVQRLCELVTQPKKHYTKCDKFMRGIEKNVLVVSTVDPHGRKIVSDSRVMVNGIDANGVSQQHDDLNEFTDEQPFAPVPQIDWSNNHAKAVWSAVGPGTDESNRKTEGSHENISQANEVMDFKTKDDIGASETSSISEKLGDTEEVDSEQGNMNNSNNTEEHLCVTDSVKLPQASSLFSNIESSESSKVNITESAINQKDSSVDATNSALDTDNVSTESDSANSEQTDNNTSDTEVVSSSENPMETESEIADEKLESDESSVENQDKMSDSSEEKSSETKQTEQCSSLIRSASDEGEGPPEKRMRMSPAEDTTDNTSEDTTHTTTQSDCSEEEEKENRAAEMSESLKESCQDTDTMPFVPTSNTEFTESESCQSLSSLDENQSHSDQSGSSLQNEGQESVESKENTSEVNTDTANVDPHPVTSSDDTAADSTEENSKNEETNTETEVSVPANEKQGDSEPANEKQEDSEPDNEKQEDSKPANEKQEVSEPANEKQEDSKPANETQEDNKPANEKQEVSEPANEKQEDKVEAMDTENATEKTEHPPTQDESEPMDQE